MKQDDAGHLLGDGVDSNGAKGVGELSTRVVISGMHSALRDAWIRATGGCSEAEFNVVTEGFTDVGGWAEHMDEADGMAQLAGSAASSSPVPNRERTSARSPAVACGVAALLETSPALQVVVLYQPPWEAYVEACRERELTNPEEALTWMEAWSAYHQDVLVARRDAPDKVFLVNMGRSEKPQDYMPLLHAESLVSNRPVQAGEVPVLRSNDTSVSRLLAAHMAEVGREFWEVYEDLESCALLIEREPEFQGFANLTEVTDLASMLIAIHDIQRDVLINKEATFKFSRLEAELESVRDMCRTAEAEQRRASSLVAELHQENELLSLQLQQVHDELNHHVTSNQQLRELLRESGDTAERARRMISTLAPNTYPA